MNLEKAIEKLTNEFGELGLGSLMINKGYPLFEIWVEDSKGRESFISSYRYAHQQENSNPDSVGDMLLVEIRFENDTQEAMSYETLKNKVYKDVLSHLKKF